jgi:hypothetical protein
VLRQIRQVMDRSGGIHPRPRGPFLHVPENRPIAGTGPSPGAFSGNSRPTAKVMVGCMPYSLTGTCPYSSTRPIPCGTNWFHWVRYAPSSVAYMCPRKVRRFTASGGGDPRIEPQSLRRISRDHRMHGASPWCIILTARRDPIWRPRKSN